VWEQSKVHAMEPAKVFLWERVKDLLLEILMEPEMAQ
jgi:hypothetical protein